MKHILTVIFIALIWPASGQHYGYMAIQKAIDSAIHNPSLCTAVYFPVGQYRITRPLLLQYALNGRWQFFTIRLFGDVPAKSASSNYLSSIICDFKDGFATGIQLGRGIQDKPGSDFDF